MKVTKIKVFFSGHHLELWASVFEESSDISWDETNYLDYENEEIEEYINNNFEFLRNKFIETKYQ